ncbi:MAG: AtpZ/AtpI family protein [Gemmatimonadales bacterium]|nr:AtpZ/AtpI family protein [Gemmatimonadales bacterium]MYG47782.1 AtpZ/AtpI family protein [Gemmatimonadales bacterium]MYK01166.1 AtpZ/AtpI family protein [Candidatus Palauibacter ramosifaciens]
MPQPHPGSTNRPKPEKPEGHAGRLQAKAAGTEFASLGIGMGLAIALLAVGGNWLDDRLGTAPLFVLLGVFAGFAGGCYSMYGRLAARREGSRPAEADGDTDRGT